MAGARRAGHQRKSSDELRAADLEEMYEDVYEQQRGSGKRDSGRTLVTRKSVDNGPHDGDGLSRQKSHGRHRRSAQNQVVTEAQPALLRSSRSLEGLDARAAGYVQFDDEGGRGGGGGVGGGVVVVGGGGGSGVGGSSLAEARKESKRRSKDRKHDRRAKREHLSMLVDNGSASSPGALAVPARVAADRAPGGVELMRAHSPAGFPDADLKLGFAAIKNRLQKSLMACCASVDGSEELRRKHGSQGDASDVWRSEHFWLELRARVHRVDMGEARLFVTEQRGRLPDLVERILNFQVGPGEDQEFCVNSLLDEVADAQELYHTREKLRAGCWEWKHNEEKLESLLHHLSMWKQTGNQLRAFHAACTEAFDPPDDTYAGWVSCLARSPSSKRVAFYKRWVTPVMNAMSHPDEGLASRREQCQKMGLSDMGSDVGRAVLMLLRLFTALPFRDEVDSKRIGNLVDQSKQMLRFIFDTKVRSWSKLLAKNLEFVGLMRTLFSRYFELIAHEKWRLRRRVQVEALHSFVLEHRRATFESEWQFASEMKNELRDLLGDSEETFAMGFLELCMKLLSDGLETAASLDSGVQLLPAASISSIQHLLVDDLKFCKRVYAHTHLSAIYEVLEMKFLRRGLLESGHKIFRLPDPPPRKGQSTLERVDSRDKVPVVMAVPPHMCEKPLDITMLLQAWCSTNDDINGHVLVMEDDGGWEAFEVLDTNHIFGLVPGQGLDSSMDFGLRPGCLHIVAASVFALQRQRLELEMMDCRVEKGEIVGAIESKRQQFRPARNFCRVVAEQEATFKPARECLEESNVQALQIAEVLLQEVIELDSLWEDSEVALCSLAFHYTDHASKLFLNFQQISQLDRAAKDAMENHSTLLSARKDDPDGLKRTDWFRAEQLVTPGHTQPAALHRFLSDASHKVFGDICLERSTSADSASSAGDTRQQDDGKLSPRRRTRSDVSDGLSSSPVQSALSTAHSSPDGSPEASPRSTSRLGPRSKSERTPARTWRVSGVQNTSAQNVEHEPDSKPVGRQKHGGFDANCGAAAAASRQQRIIKLESTSTMPTADDEICGADSPPASPSFAGGEQERETTTAGVEAMQELVDACAVAGEPEVSLGMLAAAAVQTAGTAYRANLLGVLREHGWAQSDEKILLETKILALDSHTFSSDKDLCANGNAFSCNMSSREARQRLGADLALLSVSAVIPTTQGARDNTEPDLNGGVDRNADSVPQDSIRARSDSEDSLSKLRAGARAVMAMNRFAAGSSNIKSPPSTVRPAILVRQQSPFASTYASRVLKRLDSDPLRARDEWLRSQQLIGSVIEKSTAPPSPTADVPSCFRLPGSAAATRDGPPPGTQAHVRHGRITLFVTTRTHLQATLDDNLYVKSYLQRVGLETGTTIHEIDVGIEGRNDLRQLFRPAGRPSYELPQVFFGTKWMGGAAAIRKMESDGTTAGLMRGLTAQDWIEIPFSAIKLVQDQHGRAMKLGSGKSGQVYAGTWQGNKCAVKRFQIDEEHEAEFLAEMGMLQMLRHPHIVNFYGAVTTGTHPQLGHAQCIITERCFMSLYHVLKKYGQQTASGVADAKARISLNVRVGTYLVGAAKGMAFLHSKDIIHRDLKSANLLLTQNQPSGRVVVCDFALSRLSGHALTQAGLGTPGWIAPEAWLGDPVSTSSDVYGFAMVMFEILTATLPLESFRVESEAQLTTVQYRMCAENLRPPLPDLDKQAKFFSGTAAVGSDVSKPSPTSGTDLAPSGENQQYTRIREVLDDYCVLLRECWQRDPRARPTFEQVVLRLEAMARELAAS